MGVLVAWFDGVLARLKAPRKSTLPAALAGEVDEEGGPSTSMPALSSRGKDVLHAGTEKSAMLSSPSEQRLFSVISYHWGP